MDNTTAPDARVTLVCGACGRDRTSPDCDQRKHWGYGASTLRVRYNRANPGLDPLQSPAPPAIVVATQTEGYTE